MKSRAAVLHGLLYSLREIRYLHGDPHFVLLNAMLEYVDSFLERLHHPKEDQYLFERLRARYAGAESLLDRLRGEHVSGEEQRASSAGERSQSDRHSRKIAGAQRLRGGCEWTPREPNTLRVRLHSSDAALPSS